MSADIFHPATAAEMVESARHVLACILPEGTQPPTPKETAKAKQEASNLEAWLRGNLKNHRNRAEIAAELEWVIMAKISRIYLMWGLSTDTAYLGQFLMNLESLLDVAGPEVSAAIGRADFREREEYRQLKKAADSLSLEAGRARSQRLEDAANVLRSMMGPFRIEPEAPAKAAHKSTGKAGGDARGTPIRNTNKAMIAEYRKLRFVGAYAAAYDEQYGMVEKYKEQAQSDGWEMKSKNPGKQLYKLFKDSELINL